MNEKDAKILKLGDEHHLIVSKEYYMNDNNNKIMVSYNLNNGPSAIEVLLEKEEYKELDMLYTQFTKRLFELYDIRHSQENEFFID